MFLANFVLLLLFNRIGGDSLARYTLMAVVQLSSSVQKRVITVILRAMKNRIRIPENQKKHNFKWLYRLGCSIVVSMQGRSFEFSRKILVFFKRGSHLVVCSAAKYCPNNTCAPHIFTLSTWRIHSIENLYKKETPRWSFWAIVEMVVLFVLKSFTK